ncbi:MAG: hypothetical protein ACRCZO_14450, partial [Cetobacterium sp.]
LMGLTKIHKFGMGHQDNALKEPEKFQTSATLWSKFITKFTQMLTTCSVSAQCHLVVRRYEKFIFLLITSDGFVQKS